MKQLAKIHRCEVKISDDYMNNKERVNHLLNIANEINRKKRKIEKRLVNDVNKIKNMCNR